MRLYISDNICCCLWDIWLNSKLHDNLSGIVVRYISSLTKLLLNYEKQRCSPMHNIQVEFSFLANVRLYRNDNLRCIQWRKCRQNQCSFSMPTRAIVRIQSDWRDKQLIDSHHTMTSSNGTIISHMCCTEKEIFFDKFKGKTWLWKIK